MSDGRKGWLTPSQMRRLGRACAALLPLGSVYHVGSSVMPEPGVIPRDIDLRMLLIAAEYDKHTPEQWAVLADCIGRSLETDTGIGPIDFQVQEINAANAEHKGLRSAIFVLGMDDR